MKLKAMIMEFNENIEEEILVLVNDSFLLNTFYLASSPNLFPLSEGTEYNVEISIVILYNTEIEQIKENKKTIEQDGKSFKHYIYGKLDVEQLMIKSIIDVPLEKEYIFDYSFCDQKYIKMKIDMFNIEFLSYY